ncbi:hypothetical protein [Actinokineospora diospyrosa]|uniref:Uncharacterized protein n=1 Tax=Actinokineospora diospyrosa TaxID=103728 RepID=A0ABT1IER7_9PSEU|nr:hypothetical protein [Actinokineospora diospyrosa]MCP2271110.1 hypothetical protein [Actinokineospora diospyrosa]
MPTHSASDGQPITFDRDFRVWRYGAAHAELELRTVPDADQDTIVLRFHHVVGVKLRTAYRPLEISVAEPVAAAEMAQFCAVTPKWRDRLHFLTLTSQTGDGFVVCGSYTATAYPPGSDVDDRAAPGSRLILGSGTR